MQNKKLSNRSKFPAKPKTSRTYLAKSVSAAIATMVATSSPLYAQGLLEEIIVTATKRSESVQDVPLAITALSGDFTQSINLNDVKDLISFTPGISGNSQDSFIDAVSIRGVRTQDFGVGGDPSAAIFKNELYEGRNGSAVTSLYDIDRSEVLRGPQGFLFGRNSIGGAISVHTRKAEIGSSEGYINADIGERGHLVFEGAVNIPVSDLFALRLAGYSSQEDGFVNNLNGGDDLIAHEKHGFRLSSTYDSEALKVNTMVEYETREQSGSVYRAITTGAIYDNLVDLLGQGGRTLAIRGGEGDVDVDLATGDNDDADILSLGLKAEYEFDWATLSYNIGYKDHDFFYTEDYDGTPLNINDYQQDQKGTYFQNEVRLASNGDGPLSWYAGLSSYQEDIDARFLLTGEEDIFCAYYGNAYYPGNGITDCASYFTYNSSAFTAAPDGQLNETGRVIGDYSGWAAYIDISYEISPQWDINAGLRYSNDKKDFNINVPQPGSEFGPIFAYGFTTDGDIASSDSWSDTQIRLITRYRLNDDQMLFASYTEGFKSGGFGSFALNDANGDQVPCCTTDVTQASGASSRSFRPESIDSYELGYKGSINDSTDVSISAFLYDYTDLQISFFDANSGANTVENVGSVDGFGIESSVTSRLSENWDLYTAISYLDTEATGLQLVCDGPTTTSCEGSNLFWAPDWTGAFVLNAHYPVKGGEITSSLEGQWESERGGGWGSFPETMIDSHFEMAWRIGYDSADNWGVGLYIENLTDSFTYDGQNNNGGILPSHFFGPRRPRTVGLTFNYSWQ